MDRKEAYQLITSWTENKNLVKHMLAVEAEMIAIASYLNGRPAYVKDFGEASEAEWGLLGLVHDADYEKWPEEHPKKLLAELEKRGAQKWLIDGVRAHAWKYNGIDREPQNKMEWAIYICDELSGFIIACALVRPDPSTGSGQAENSKLHQLTVDSILKKWPQKSFAAGVHREQVELCEEKLEIKLPEFIEICLKALQGISGELGL